MPVDRIDNLRVVQRRLAQVALTMSVILLIAGLLVGRTCNW